MGKRASPVTLTQIAKVIWEGDANITRVWGVGMPKARGCPYHCNNAVAESTQCGPCSVSLVDVTCGLSLLLVSTFWFSPPLLPFSSFLFYSIVLICVWFERPLPLAQVMNLLLLKRKTAQREIKRREYVFCDLFVVFNLFRWFLSCPFFATCFPVWKAINGWNHTTSVFHKISYN